MHPPVKLDILLIGRIGQERAIKIFWGKLKMIFCSYNSSVHFLKNVMTSKFDSWQACRVRSKVCESNSKAEDLSLYKFIASSPAGLVGIGLKSSDIFKYRVDVTGLGLKLDHSKGHEV